MFGFGSYSESLRWFESSLADVIFPSVGVVLVMFFQVLEDFLLFLNLPGIVFSLLIGDFDLELIIFELFLLPFNFNTKVEEFLLKSRLILLQSGLFGLLGDEAILDLNGSWEYFVDEFFALLCEHFEFNFLFLFGLDLLEKIVVVLCWWWCCRVLRWEWGFFHSCWEGYGWIKVWDLCNYYVIYKN